MYVLPRVNVIDNEHDVIIEAELPGVAKDGVELELKDGELTLVGHAAREADARGRRHINERPNADYKRTFAVSEAAIDTGKVKAD
ncbi:MAG TPA: Hsp20/alpha crystallin family protein, partial [Candidatus Hydrogenedentes bacterium]|nr:Hsp20/alpha crystallin family protein [Candidatus Hydrogenedentota bacterium]